MIVARALLAALALGWLAPLVAELLLLIGRRSSTGDPGPLSSGTMSLLFLVPAHDEEALIASCVQSLVRMRSETSRSRIVVVADNCTDETARRAEAAGATALERHDPERRGKPAAIEWARHTLDTREHDAIVIIDADTVVDEDFADALARKGPLADKVVQAVFGVRNPRSSWLSTLGNLLMRIRYEGQYPMKARAGIDCPLTGNGMCIGIRALERVGWPSDSLTENWELYARCVSHGVFVDYQREALLYSEEAESLSAGAVQRRRWQSGRWSVARRYAGPILRSSVGPRQKVDALVELASPSPVIHSAIGLAAAAVTWGLGMPVVAGLFLASTLPIFAWTVWAWATSERRASVALALMRLPVYALWRLAIWGGSIFRRKDRAWRRSPRQGI